MSDFSQTINAPAGTKGMALVAIGLCGLVAVLPPAFLPYYVASVLFLVIAFFSIANPIFLLYIVILTSALAGLLRAFESLQIGVGGVSLSGLRWVLLFGLAIVVLTANFASIRVPKAVVPFLIFAAWAGLRFLYTPSGVQGGKDVIFYALPAVVGVYTLFVLRASNGRAIGQIERAILYSVAIPVTIYLILFTFALVAFTSRGPQGLIGPRAVALYLLVVLVLALAAFRYGEAPIERRSGAIVACIALLAILLTLSRTASVTALGVVLFSRMKPRYPLRLALRFAAVLALAVLLMWKIPFFRERSFHSVEDSLIESITQFNTMGRAAMWPLTLANALRSPAIGLGPGSARLMLGESLPQLGRVEYHPHNEYLQVFHDLGLVGLVLLLWSWGSVSMQRWRSWGKAHDAGDRFKAKWNLAGILAAAVVLVTALTDNTLHYVFITAPVLMILMVPTFWDEEETANEPTDTESYE